MDQGAPRLHFGPGRLSEVTDPRDATSSHCSILRPCIGSCTTPTGPLVNLVSHNISAKVSTMHKDAEDAVIPFPTSPPQSPSSHNTSHRSQDTPLLKHYACCGVAGKSLLSGWNRRTTSATAPLAIYVALRVLPAIAALPTLAPAPV